MTRILCILSSLVVATACGGSSSRPAPTTPPPADPVPMVEGPTAAEPTNGIDPGPAVVDPPTPAPPAPAQIKADLLAVELAAFEKAKPVFDKWCAKCHSKSGRKQSASKREHFDMTTYPFGGHHAMDVHNEVRKALGLAGQKPTMPADNKGAVKGAELEAIKAWADAFEASHEGGAHEGHGHRHGDHKHGH
jgi:hypothetical protein